MNKPPRTTPPRSRQPRRGFTLLLVVTLAGLIAISTAAFLNRMTTSARQTSDLVKRRNAFFAADGMGRMIVRQSQIYFGSDSTPTSAELTAAVTANINALTPSGYTRESWSVGPVGASNVNGTIPNGPFAGMNGMLNTIQLQASIRKTGGMEAGATSSQVTLAKIAMFQFFLFADGFVDWYPGPAQDVRGRSHANGNFCFASGSAFRLANITSAGRIYWGGVAGANCPLGQNGTNGQVATNTGFSAFASLNAANRSSGCTGCDGTGLNWRTWAVGKWNDLVQDTDMGVTPLRLPIQSNVTTQAGAYADGTVKQNVANSRILVDAPHSGDGGDIRAQKMACKADIRILNGVWYVRDVGDTNCTNWPGTPIWSDHPGNFNAGVNTDWEQNVLGSVSTGVGQAQLDTARAWGGAIPRQYSPYAYENGTTALYAPLGTGQHVVSYGWLHRDTGVAGYFRGVAYSPGMPVDWARVSATFPLCAAALSGTGAGQLSYSAFTAFPYTCPGPVTLPAQSVLLNGTRAGFADGHVHDLSYTGPATSPATTNRQQRAAVLPLNFDVRALQAALNNTTVGELGSYFVTGTRDFNGIVYITNTWPGSEAGYPGSYPSGGTGGWPTELVPVVGGVSQWHKRAVNAGATTQPGRTGRDDTTWTQVMMNQALPAQLCSTSLSGQDFHTGVPAAARFKVPACPDNPYDSDPPATFPNVVRVFHADDLTSLTGNAKIPKGLTIVSNLPVYALGNLNQTSNVSTGSSTPWKPFLLGGDQVMLLSDVWQDINSSWLRADNAWGSQPTASTSTTGCVAANASSSNPCTIYNFQMLAGNAQTNATAYSGGIENFPRFLEDWGGSRDNIINGSFVLGYTSTYYHHTRSGTPYSPPRRLWSYDLHLDAIGNQPPGAPTYDVSAVKAWSRD